MSLAKRIDPEEFLNNIQHKPHHHQHKRALCHFTYGTKYTAGSEIPKYRIPPHGTDATSVGQLIKDDLDLDGKPNLNLASFVTTFMEEQADKLMADNISKNLADNDEYPALITTHSRCVSIISHLWNVPKGCKAIGTATTGSSEGIHLGGLAMKRRWQAARKAAGKDASNPNILMGANAQVALEKFARYFEVEARILPVSEESHYCLDPKLVRENIDENTIGVFVIMGSTYTGHYEPVEEVSKILDEYEAETGYSIPIHVDAASGGFVAPFTEHTNGKWSFDVPRVKSINVSGHKYGLVYPGIGWVLWKDEAYLPKELIFELHYLGGTEQTYTLNFSRPGAHVVAQYFNFLHLGKDGYAAVMANCLYNARRLSRALEETGWYTCVSDIHRKNGIYTSSKGDHDQSSSSDAESRQRKSLIDDLKNYNPGLPVVSFRFSDDFKQKHPYIRQATVSILLRAKGYIIPNYSLPPNLSGTEILRVVIRVSMSGDLLDRLIADVIETTETLIEAHDAAKESIPDLVDLKAFSGTEEAAPHTIGGKIPRDRRGSLARSVTGIGGVGGLERRLTSLGKKAARPAYEGLEDDEGLGLEGLALDTVEGADRGLLRSTC